MAATEWNLQIPGERPITLDRWDLECLLEAEAHLRGRIRNPAVQRVPEMA
jgi:hypothetical protein